MISLNCIPCHFACEVQAHRLDQGVNDKNLKLCIFTKSSHLYTQSTSSPPSALVCAAPRAPLAVALDVASSIKNLENGEGAVRLPPETTDLIRHDAGEVGVLKVQFLCLFFIWTKTRMSSR